MIDSLISDPTWFKLTVVGLATWRLAIMLVGERGPFDLLTKIRRLAGVQHTEDGEPIAWPDNSVFMCLYCTSFWTGVLFIVLPWWAAVPFAMSALAVGYDALLARLNWRPSERVSGGHNG